MKKVCIYLRKSRADEEAEKRGEGETLSKHRKLLLKTAKSMSLNIVKIREEIVSGESLDHRPEMQKLLDEVENKDYDAVLVMDVDRLGRGNMQEQGLILETFKKSKTKIITPRKTYDLSDEFDEEYSEFEAFMARKELKIINRRLQRGRIESVKGGNYNSPIPPFGYEIAYIGKDRTLSPHPEESPIVKLMFDLYVNENLGFNKIANKLNELGYRSAKGKEWYGGIVGGIIKNPTYAGKIVWNKTTNNKNNDISDWIIVDGKHEAIISEEMFYKAHEILKSKGHVASSKQQVNPLAGLIICEQCNATMVYRPYEKRAPHMICYKTCGNKSSRLDLVEESVLQGLKDWLTQYKASWNMNKLTSIDVPKDDISELYRKALAGLQYELAETDKQRNNLHDLLERGVYDVDTYLERSNVIATKMEEIENAIKKTKIDLKNAEKTFKTKTDIIPKVEKVLELYKKTDDPERKNILLKSVLDYCLYKKEKHQKNDDFTLILHPKLPN